MDYYLVEGKIINSFNLTPELMEKHKIYTQKAMDNGMILMSGLKSDHSGVLFIAYTSMEELAHYLKYEPFNLMKIQSYEFKSFDIHYFNEELQAWKQSN